MATVVVLGTLDTKGNEHNFVNQIIRKTSCDVVLIDIGVLGQPQTQPDINREEVALAGGVEIEELVKRNDRGFAMEVMAIGATKIIRQLHQDGKLDGILALGGSGGASIATHAMRALPIGVPKLMVSTVASGDTKPYVGESDITMMYSVVDIAGINSISGKILNNAAIAIAEMAKASCTIQPQKENKPLISITMFGVTTPCVLRASKWLEKKGYEVVVFSANGVGGRAMEALMKDGFISAVLDVTTTELADELVGGELSAGQDRLEMAGQLGIPQVVSLGALDMVNFGPVDTLPTHFHGRKIYKHNPNVTLMRTTVEECDQLGKIIAYKLNRAKGPVSVFIPLKGISAIAKKGEVFYDPQADQALIDSLKESLDPHIDLVVMDTHINDPAFAEEMAKKLHELYSNYKKIGVLNYE
ncbi:Tm-1-like ATP-binding domain-containing protein [Heyndrickxia acidicola]|uniref:Tm-1-like ATP-binding domain-containing protein n=1 Tax=Heyndrickxia acidicola TaxID=209389 RepID=A0ABU6MPJ3_9BACI|nr:Tm-1-like ATP-binding domain-containing protein [Heyndrickxia acidicola]MED1205558.1 Tm-1-like ATP-binding domain-containing protein [Heyndrickxia acidicola]